MTSETTQWVVKVVDFGVARVHDQFGIMIAETGTYRWMALEVLNSEVITCNLVAEAAGRNPAGRAASTSSVAASPSSAASHLGLDSLQQQLQIGSRQSDRRNSLSLPQNLLDGNHESDYKKMIRRHMDFNTRRSRISNQEIKSMKELLIDLLLLANNALLFYSETTRVYKSALLVVQL